MGLIKSFREVHIWQNAIDAAMRIFEVSEAFPRSERFSLTDQIRRSSRSVAANFAEAWWRRRYRAAFISKLNECECEAAETQTWIEFALRYGYIDQSSYKELTQMYDRILGQLVTMMVEADKWLIHEDETEYLPNPNSPQDPPETD